MPQYSNPHRIHLPPIAPEQVVSSPPRGSIDRGTGIVLIDSFINQSINCLQPHQRMNHLRNECQRFAQSLCRRVSVVIFLEVFQHQKMIPNDGCDVFYGPRVR